MNRNDILEAAKLIINGEREGQYGAPEDSFNNIARLWSIYLGCNLGPSDVANLMVLMKVARNMNGVYKADNWVDMAGYSALGGELQNLEEQKPTYKEYCDAELEKQQINYKKYCDAALEKQQIQYKEYYDSERRAMRNIIDTWNINDTNMCKEDK